MKKIISLLLSATLLVACDASSSTPTSSTTTLKSNICMDCGFDTFFAVQGMPLEQDEFDTVFTEASSDFSYYNKLFDIYNDYEGINNIKTINDNAGIQPVEVDPVIIEMLQEAKYFYDLSDGEFDITIGALLKVWHNYREEGIDLNTEGKKGNLPTEQELEEASSHKGWEHVQIDTEQNTVYIDDDSISLDVGGIAKGFSTEKIAQSLESEGITTGAINAGGNNRTLGQKYDGSNWRVGIQNPQGSDSILVVNMDDKCSFVTSGDYERYYVASDGNSYHHIIDPETLYPAKHFHSVSIITEDSGVADCLSTTLFTLSYEDGLKVLAAYKEDHPDTFLEAIWIMDEDTEIDTEYKHVTDNQLIVYSEGLEGKLTWVD